MINRKGCGIAVTDRLCIHLASTAWTQTGGEGIGAEERRGQGEIEELRETITKKEDEKVIINMQKEGQEGGIES